MNVLPIPPSRAIIVTRTFSNTSCFALFRFSHVVPTTWIINCLIVTCLMWTLLSKTIYFLLCLSDIILDVILLYFSAVPKLCLPLAGQLLRLPGHTGYPYNVVSGHFWCACAPPTWTFCRHRQHTLTTWCIFIFGWDNEKANSNGQAAD